MGKIVDDDILIVGIDEETFQGFVALPGDTEQETESSVIVVTDLFLEQEDIDILKKIKETLSEEEREVFRLLLEKVIFSAYHLTPYMRAKAEE